MATVNLGSIKFKWKGTYSGATAYTVDDVVEYNGSSYMCKLASTGNLPTNTTYFDIMAEGGDVATTLTTQGDILYRDGSGLARLGVGTSGQFLKTQGAGANPIWADAGGGLQSMQVFTTSGTATYTKPSGINKIKIYVTGGGAGGGSGTGAFNIGGGGGAGGTAIKIIDATSITTETVTVGAGGNGANSNSNTQGSSGGTSSFGSHASATGGTGGYWATNSGQPTAGRGGNGSSGDINIVGGKGGHHGANNSSDSSGGGFGGASFWGGGGSVANHWSTTGADGGTNVAYGAGGGGGTDVGYSGASGNSGIVIVEEYK